VSQDSAYRDELAAAHARIAELEHQLALRRGFPDAADAWLARMRSEREHVLAKSRRGLRRPEQAALVGFAVFFCVLFPAIIQVLAGTWPLSVAIGAIGVLTLGLTYGVAIAGRREALRRQLARIDEKIEDVGRMLAIAQEQAGRAAEASGRVRVSATTDDEASGDGDLAADVPAPIAVRAKRT
jgi:hypothetical protein